MKKKLLTMLLAMTMTVGILVGCAKEDAQNVKEESQQEMEEAEEAEETESVESDDVLIRVASLKGPTSIGLVNLWEEDKNGEAEGNYEFSMMVGADEIMPLMMKGEMDIALLPANAAANLYQKSEGKVCVIDINTLGVLYMVSSDESIVSIEDLKGKTVYLTGKGTTPDFALQSLLAKNNVSLDEVTLEYKSEATEVAAILASEENAIGLLPQPFVTAACTKNEALKVVINLNEQWEKAYDGNGLVTGVTVVRKAFLEEHPVAVETFMSEQEKSANKANAEVDGTAELVSQNGIVEKAPIAKKAIPNCNITYIAGDEMKQMLSTYLATLYEQDPAFIGGNMPADDFYYTGK